MIDPNKLARGEAFFADPGHPDVRIPDVCSSEVIGNRRPGCVTLDSPVPGKPTFWFVIQGERGAVYSILELKEQAPG